MDAHRPPSTSLFDVYLRLRPPHAQANDPFVDLDDQTEGRHTHITIKPPHSDGRKRAVEKFSFTRVFDEDASQIDILNGISLLPQLEGVLAPNGRASRDGLLATLGVTGSGKVCLYSDLLAKSAAILIRRRVTQFWVPKPSVDLPSSRSMSCSRASAPTSPQHAPPFTSLLLPTDQKRKS